MSFLESGRDGYIWAAAPLLHSVRQRPGCAQCGNRLEMDASGRYAASGKCENCINRVSDEDEMFGGLEEF